MKKTILSIALSLLGLGVMAQGQPHAKIFSNFNYELSGEENPFKAFEVNRAYLGYGYTYNENFSAKVTFDVGNVGAEKNEYVAFLKIAQVTWKANSNLKINFGQVGTKNFKFMEKAWGHRYIYKSLQDKNKWASSADAGVTADYKINSSLSLDAQVLNGEGYKKNQGENGLFRGGVGLTFNATDELAVRLHRDVSPRSSYTETGAHQNTTSAAVAYSGEGFNVGFEYNMQEGANNVTDQVRKGTSVYGAYDLGDGVSIFGRYDELTSENDWNLDKDGTFMIAGVEKVMTKGVKASLNYQSFTEATDGAESENTLYLSLEYKF